MKRMLLIILACCAISAAAVAAVLAAETTAREIPVGIPIPNVTHPCATQNGQVAGSGHCVASYGAYVAGIYQYASGVIGVVAAFMVLYGGLKWITASGNTKRVDDAKATIYAAIAAIILILGSYTLLYTINPQLTNLQLPNVQPITRVEQGTEFCQDLPSTARLLSIAGASGVGPACDPRYNPNCCGSAGCCGTEFDVDLGGGVQGQCIANDCLQNGFVCATKQEGGYGCVTAESFCEDLTSSDRRSNCPKADRTLQSIKTAGGKQKFANYGCAFVEDKVSIGDLLGLDRCVYGKLFTSFATADFTKHDDLEDYETRFVDCFTPEAEGECWEEEKNGQKVSRDCAGSDGIEGHVWRCKNPTEVPRPVAGADAGCLVKKPDQRKNGNGGQLVQDDFKCWKTKE